jgi:hypothetical protein
MWIPPCGFIYSQINICSEKDLVFSHWQISAYMQIPHLALFYSSFLCESFTIAIATHMKKVVAGPTWIN